MQKKKSLGASRACIYYGLLTAIGRVLIKNFWRNQKYQLYVIADYRTFRLIPLFLFLLLLFGEVLIKLIFTIYNKYKIFLAPFCLRKANLSILCLLLIKDLNLLPLSDLLLVRDAVLMYKCMNNLHLIISPVCSRSTLAYINIIIEIARTFISLSVVLLRPKTLFPIEEFLFGIPFLVKS